MKYVLVAINLPVKNLFRQFIYSLPDALQQAGEGWRVIVPFGPQKVEGFVVRAFTREEAAVLLQKENPDFAFDKIREVTAALDTRPWFSEEMLVTAIKTRQEMPAEMKYSHVISRAEKYVKENYTDPNISLISVAKHIGMSAAHFSTVFSQTMGRPFIHYLTGLRIEQAKELLKTTNMRLSLTHSTNISITRNSKG